jgi:hypothetical protein
MREVRRREEEKKRIIEGRSGILPKVLYYH